MKTKILVADLKEESYFRDHLSPPFRNQWERAVEAVERADWKLYEFVDSADLALCVYLTALMPEDIEPAQFLAQCEREGYPFCEELDINILEYLEQVLTNSGLSARVLDIEIGLDSAEVHRLSENPLTRELSFTLPDSPFVQQKVSVFTRIPQSVLQRLATFTGHGFPIKQTQ